ncbi:MAG: hypothetical protein JWP44_1542, partial [Mucilaginibacter sp.]|nr:hypothetical protein [Mucilaginibacter sp.]
SWVQNLKISLITVSLNAESTISRCIESVITQTYKNIQYIIIDGGSNDSTISIIDKYKDFIDIFISEPDNGLYDAMNKGIRMADGKVIGMLNADDFFTDRNVISKIAGVFMAQNANILYADLDFINTRGDIVRKWRSGRYKHNMFSWGWMPPHPTFYCKRKLFDEMGYYDLEYGTAADYELMLRFMHFNKVNAIYLKEVTIMMQIGGISNKSFSNRVKGLLSDMKAMRNNGILFPFITLLLKPLRKIIQYF